MHLRHFIYLSLQESVSVADWQKALVSSKQSGVQHYQQLLRPVEASLRMWSATTVIDLLGQGRTFNVDELSSAKSKQRGSLRLENDVNNVPGYHDIKKMYKGVF